MEGDGEVEKREGIKWEICCSLLVGGGSIGGLGVSLVLFLTYWIEERSDMSFLLRSMHVTENRSDDFFSGCFLTNWYFKSI